MYYFSGTLNAYMPAKVEFIHRTGRIHS